MVAKSKNSISIILDTDVIVAERFLRSPSARAVLKGSAIINAKIIIPEVVLDEVLALYKKHLKAMVEQYERSGKELGYYLDAMTPRIDVEEHYEIYKNWLFEQIRKYEISVVKYPQLDLKELVTKSCATHFLFEDNPEGHNDYLVWKSIVNHFAKLGNTAEGSRPCIFVTHNKRVFCSHSDGFWSLDESLRAEIAKSEDEFDVTFSLKTVFDHHIKPNLTGDTVEEIDVIYYIQSKFDEELLRIVNEEMTNRPIRGFEGVPLDNLVIKMMTDLQTDEVEWVRLSDRELHVYCDGTMELQLEGFLKRSELWSVDMQEDEIFIIDLDASELGSTAGCNLVADFVFVAIFDRQVGRLTSYELMLMEEMKPENYA